MSYISSEVGRELNTPTHNNRFSFKVGLHGYLVDGKFLVCHTFSGARGRKNPLWRVSFCLILRNFIVRFGSEAATREVAQSEN